MILYHVQSGLAKIKIYAKNPRQAALDISLYELMLRDINNWINDPEKIRKNDLNITLIQPKDFIFESTEFSKCKIGTEYGLNNSTMYNPMEMQALFYQFNTLNFLNYAK